MPLPYPVSFTVLNLLYYPPFLLFYYLLTHLTTPPTRLFAAALFSLYYVIFPVFITTTWLPIDFALSAAGFVFLMRFLDTSRRPYAVTCDLPLDQFWLETHALPVRGAFDGKASRQWRMGGVHKLARFGMKFAVLKWVAPWLTVSARDAVEMYAWGTARGMWWDAVYGMVFYLFLGMIGDVAFGTYQVMSGVEMEDIFDTPFLAESPRDFWRRWNRLIHKNLHSLIFQPSFPTSSHQTTFTPATRTLRAFAVFLFSGLLHEWILWTIFGTATGENLVFFLLHGLATVAEVQWWITMKGRVPRWMAVGMHTMWIVGTARLFLRPYARGGFFERRNWGVTGILMPE